MIEDFKNFIKQLGIPHAKFAVAVSGGIDSSTLCELCAKAGQPFFIVHCNFKLRGGESDRDESFVRSLADKYQTEVFVREFDTQKFALENKCSIQVAARELRYAWFAELHKEDKNVYVLLAHHANDNVETLLINFFRGTGLDGMTGMPNLSYHHCLRPMLNYTRAEIEAFAKENQVFWVEDSSNEESKYTRNFFRNELILMLRKVYPSVEENLLDNIKRFKTIDTLYQVGLEKIKKEVIEVKGAEVIIPIHKLNPYLNSSLVFEIIRDFGFGEKQVAEVLKLIKTDSGKYVANESFEIIKHRKNLIITPKKEQPKSVAVIEKDSSEVAVSEMTISLNRYPAEKFVLNKNENVAQLDADLLEFPLLVRPWKQGDYFYPLGLRKKKKLSRFFIDQKLSRVDKERVLIVESNGKIAWIVGYRIDDRFKVTSKSKNTLTLRTNIYQTE